MSVPLSCCLWRFPISDKDPDLMEILGYTSTESLRWDYSESEQYYILVIPPARTVKTLYVITPVYAWQWFRINGGNNLRVVYYPFSQVHFNNVTDPCDCPPEPPEPPAPPVVTSVTLSHGLGGDSVVIGGLHFTGANFMVFGVISASFNFVSDIELTATVPSGPSPGTVVEVIVRTDVGTSDENPPFDEFTYDAPPPVVVYVTWDPASTIFAALSMGNLDASVGLEYPQAVTATVSKTTGKWYFEIMLVNENSGDSYGKYGFGVMPPSSTYEDYCNGSTGSRIRDDGVIDNSALSLGFLQPNDVVGVAVDLDNAKVWYKVVAGPDFSGTSYWNGLITGNPVTNVNGSPLFDSGQAEFPISAFSSLRSLDAQSANFGGSAFSGALPSGYSAWGSGVTYNPARATTVALSGGNLTATNLAPSRYPGVQSTVSHSSGKWYCELTLSRIRTTNITNFGIGVSVVGGSFDQFQSHKGIDGVYFEGVQSCKIYTNGTWFSQSLSTVGTGGNGNVYAMAIDLDNNKFWIQVVGGPDSNPKLGWNGVSGNPATNVGGIAIPPAGAKAIYATFSNNEQGLAFFGDFDNEQFEGSGNTFAATISTNSTVNTNNRVVIHQDYLNYSATKFTITLHGNTIGSTAIDAVWVGNANQSVNPWNFDGTQVQVRFSGSTSVTVPINGTVVSDNITYALSASVPLVISFHLSAGATVGHGPNPGATPMFSYSKTTNVASEAGTTTVTSYNASSGPWIVASIDGVGGGGIPAGFSDWDDSFSNWGTSSNWLTTLSDNNLTATNIGYDGSGTQVSRTYGRTAGKYYYELTRAFDDNTCESILTFGLGCPNFIELNQNGIGGAIAYANGTMFADGIFVGARIPGGGDMWSDSNGDVIGVAADMDHGVVWFKIVGGDDFGTFDWNGVSPGDLTQDPSTLKGGVYIPPPLTYLRWPALTYDPTTAVSTTLTNGNLTAANQLAYWRGVHATTTHSSGKWYFEVTFVKSNNAIFNQAGMVIAPTSVTNWEDAVEVNGVILFANDGGTLVNGSVFGTSLKSFSNTTVGDVYGVAVDLTNNKAWFRIVGGPNINLNWNNNGAANPATNVGGASLAGGSTYIQAACNFYRDNDTTEAWTGNFGGSAFTGAAPAGFSAWGNTTTWDPANNLNMALSGGNLIATNTTSNPENQGVKVATTIAQSEGKYYFESTVDVATQSNGGLPGGPGIALTTALYTELFEFAGNGAAVSSPYGNIFINGDQPASLGALVSGDTIGIAVDLYNRKIWFKNVAGPSSSGKFWNGDADADPGANIGGLAIISGSMVPVVYFGANKYPGSSTITVNFNPAVIPIDTVGLTPLLAFSDAFPSLDSQIANFGQSPFVGTVPTGFTAGWPTTQATSPPSVNVWDSEIAIGTTLSNGNLTATNVGAAGVTQGVKSKIRKRSTQYGGAGGKFYFEITLDHVGTTTNYCFGFCVPGVNLDPILGGYDLGACYCSVTGMITENNGFGARTLGALQSGDVVACVINLTDTDNQAWGGRYWFKVVAGPSSISGSFTYWNQTGGSLVGFNSPGYLTATNNGTTSTNQGIKATEPKTSGKYYFEMTVVVANSTTATAHVAMGVMQTTGSTYSSPVGVEMFQNGNLFDNGGLFVNINSMVAGQVWGIAVDLDNRRAWFKLLSGSGSPSNWNANGAANPATNVGGAVVPAALPIVPYVSFGGTGGVFGDKFTANFGQSAFVGAVPAGFTSGWPTPVYWNGHPDDIPTDKNTGLVLDANNYVPFVIFGNTDSANAVTANFGQSAFSGTVPTWFTAGWPE